MLPILEPPSIHMPADELPKTPPHTVPQRAVAKDELLPSRRPEEEGGSGEGALSALEFFKRRQQARGLAEPKDPD